VVVVIHWGTLRPTARQRRSSSPVHRKPGRARNREDPSGLDGVQSLTGLAKRTTRYDSGCEESRQDPVFGDSGIAGNRGGMPAAHVLAVISTGTCDPFRWPVISAQMNTVREASFRLTIRAAATTEHVQMPNGELTRRYDSINEQVPHSRAFQFRHRNGVIKP
jgi:hypothetical protein